VGVSDTTIGRLLEEKAEHHPNHEAVVYSDRQLRMTYRDFDLHCRKIAKGLMKLGIEKGDHIAIWSSNTGMAGMSICYSKDGRGFGYRKYQLSDSRA
jgi:acyl-CoA synthetase (AMP-forming)/AMP-acid ligase II